MGAFVCLFRQSSLAVRGTGQWCVQDKLVVMDMIRIRATLTHEGGFRYGSLSFTKTIVDTTFWWTTSAKFSSIGIGGNTLRWYGHICMTTGRFST